MSRPPDHTGQPHRRSLASTLSCFAPLSFRTAHPAQLEPGICEAPVSSTLHQLLRSDGGNPTPRMSGAHKAMVPRVSCSLPTAPPPPLLGICSKPPTSSPSRWLCLWYVWRLCAAPTCTRVCLHVHHAPRLVPGHPTLLATAPRMLVLQVRNQRLADSPEVPQPVVGQRRLCVFKRVLLIHGSGAVLDSKGVTTNGR